MVFSEISETGRQSVSARSERITESLSGSMFFVASTLRNAGSSSANTSPVGVSHIDGKAFQRRGIERRQARPHVPRRPPD